MSQSIRFEIGSPVHGTTSIRLTAPGVDFHMVASYTPGDSIGALAQAAYGLLTDENEQVVTWSIEPFEYDFRFLNRDGCTRLEIYEFPDGRRKWRRVETPGIVVEENSVLFALALWRGLRRLRGNLSLDEYTVRWGHPFPESSVNRLGQKLGR